MKERIENKLKELEESYDYWLREYDREMQEYQENILHDIKIKILLLEEILNEKSK